MSVTTLGGLVAPIVGNDDTGAVTNTLSAMIGRQLPLFSIIIPGFMIFVMAGWRGMTQVMPAVLTAGISGNGSAGVVGYTEEHDGRQNNPNSRVPPLRQQRYHSTRIYQER